MQQNENLHYRYERKYLSFDYSSLQLKNYLLLSRAAFREIYYKRQVNSIYFDTKEFEYFQQNINGDQDRRKMRVRWYGDQAAFSNPQLEIKIKCGEIMRKEVYPLDGLTIEKMTQVVREKLSGKIEEAHALEPVLINSYQREYFLSQMDQIRITLDDQIKSQSITDWLSHRRAQGLDFSILECKYALENDRNLQSIVQTLPIQISKSSKYVMGIQQSYPHLIS